MSPLLGLTPGTAPFFIGVTLAPLEEVRGISAPREKCVGFCYVICDPVKITPIKGHIPQRDDEAKDHRNR
jgi:hypothetical protein